MSTQPTQPPSRLKKFTHEKIREQLSKRDDIPEYETYLMKCKVSEDAVGIILDTSCPAWKQLQVLVRNHESKMKELQSQQTPQSTFTPQPVPSQVPPVVSTITTTQQKPSQSQQRPPPSTPRTPVQPSHAPPPFKPLVFPRCPTENVRMLCQELFVLKPGFTGPIFRDNFTPDRIATDPTPLSPLHNLPAHIMLSPQISVPTIRRACLHNGIACIPNCLRGLVWCILLDIDISALSGYDPKSTVSNPPKSPAAFNPTPTSTTSSPPQQTAQDALLANGITADPNEDNHLPPVNGLSVIKVDLHRTYPHLDIFSMVEVQTVMERLLIKSCRVSSLDYKQGINYLLATLMLVWMPVFSRYTTDDMTPKDVSTINSPNTSANTSNNQSTQSNSSSTSTVTTTSPSSDSATHNKHMDFQLNLESNENIANKYPHTPSVLISNSPLIIASLNNLIAKLLPNTYSDHEFGSLQCLFLFFRLLLQYHDPILSYHLDFYEMTPEFYCSPWFLTLHVTRTKDISIILLLWDHLLLYLRQDPMLHYFISLSLLIDKREQLLIQQDTSLPETLSKMCISTPQHLYTLFLFACTLRLNTPPSASRLLHTISTTNIGSDGDEITLLGHMLSLEVGADESLHQTLSTNKYSYNELLTNFSSSYHSSLVNRDLSTTPQAGQSSNAPMAPPIYNSQIYQATSSASSTTPFLFIDCRDEWSFRRGHLSAAINFPLQHLNDANLRNQLLRTIAGFKSMHVCIIHDGFQPGSEEYGSMTPSHWGHLQQQQQHRATGYNNTSQFKTLTALTSFLIYEGVRYVSVVANGYLQIHKTALMLGVELVNHSEDKCPLCLNPQLYYNNASIIATNTSKGNVSLEESGVLASNKGASYGGNLTQKTGNLFSSLSKFFSYTNQATGGPVSPTKMFAQGSATPLNNTYGDNDISSTSGSESSDQESTIIQSSAASVSIEYGNIPVLRKQSTINAQPILTPPSLVSAVMVSNLRNIAVRGNPLRQSLIYAMQQLVNIALDSFNPPFIASSGYPLTGLEYNFQQDPSRIPSSSSAASPDSLWITGRIKTTSLPTPPLNSPNNSNNNTTNSKAYDYSVPPYIGYLMQSQLSIIGITRQMAYVPSADTVAVLPLKDDNASSPKSDDDELYFAHNIMIHILSAFSKQMNNMMLINTGCIEIAPSINANDFFSDNNKSDEPRSPELQEQEQQHSEVDWVPRPVTIPAGINTHHTLLFIPNLTMQTSPWVISSIAYLLEAKRLPQQQLAIIALTVTKEGFDLVQSGFRRTIQRIIVHNGGNTNVNDHTHNPDEPVQIISLSLAQQEPLNRQPPYMITDETKRLMYRKEDEYIDIYPSIAQIFSRYLQSDL